MSACIPVLYQQDKTCAKLLDIVEINKCINDFSSQKERLEKFVLHYDIINDVHVLSVAERASSDYYPIPVTNFNKTFIPKYSQNKIYSLMTFKSVLFTIATNILSYLNKEYLRNGNYFLPEKIFIRFSEIYYQFGIHIEFKESQNKYIKSNQLILAPYINDKEFKARHLNKFLSDENSFETTSLLLNMDDLFNNKTIDENKVKTYLTRLDIPNLIVLKFGSKFTSLINEIYTVFKTIPNTVRLRCEDQDVIDFLKKKDLSLEMFINSIIMFTFGMYDRNGNISNDIYFLYCINNSYDDGYRVRLLSNVISLISLFNKTISVNEINNIIIKDSKPVKHVIRI